MKYNNIKKKLQKKPKQWLVTGCAGFIGSNLVEELLKLNQVVVGLDNFSTGYQFNIDDIKENVSIDQWDNFRFVEGDITDYSTCEMITKDIDIILHQAALGSVPRSINDPVNSNNSNVNGFINLITASKDNNVQRFVYASSSSVYGDSKELPKVEDRTGMLLSPYAVTKMTNELYAKVFYDTYNLETIGLRYFNVFGKRQNPNGEYAAVIPKWLNLLFDNKSIVINGDGKTSRDFTYIKNVIQANILAGTTSNSKAYGEVFNTAVGGRMTLNDLYISIENILQTNISEYIKKSAIYLGFRKGDIRDSNANIDKIKELLEYEATHNIEDGLQEYIPWYMNQVRNSNGIY